MNFKSEKERGDYYESQAALWAQEFLNSVAMYNQMSDDLTAKNYALLKDVAVLKEKNFTIGNENKSLKVKLSNRRIVEKPLKWTPSDAIYEKCQQQEEVIKTLMTHLDEVTHLRATLNALSDLMDTLKD